MQKGALDDIIWLSTSNGVAMQQKQNCNNQINKNQVVVYYATMPSTSFALDLPTKQRNDEIANCTNLQTKRQKYFVWKLLLQAVESNFGTGACFIKQSNGKWGCNLCCFSLSHSNDVVAVAVSSRNVGVDVQRVALPKKLSVVDRVFSKQQAKDFYAIDSNEEKALYFTQVWTQKESIFKLLDANAFLPTHPQTYTQPSQSKVVQIGNDHYVITVALVDQLQVEFKQVEL